MRKLLKKLVLSPVLHFVLLGLLLYGLYEMTIPDNRETILLTNQTIEALVKQEQNISPGPLAEARKQELIENYIDEEVLIREAYKRGLDKNDYRVRQRIVYIMRNSLSEVIPEPSNAQLRAYYEDNIHLYTSDSSRSFDHVFFSPGSVLPEDPASFIKTIYSTEDFSSLGDYSANGNLVRQASYRQMAQRFGQEFTDLAFSLPINEWTGPVQSVYGNHYLRITEIIPPGIPSFEDMEQYLRSDYFIFKTRESQQSGIEELKAQYQVIIGSDE